MGWFGKDEGQAEVRKLNEAIAALQIELEGLNKTKEYVLEIDRYEKELQRLKTEINTMKIDRSKLEEEQARREREVEHSIGLLKIQMDAEADAAKREAELSVREANMAHEKEVFDNQMKFREDQFKEQYEAMQGLTRKILEHLPNVNYDISETREHRAAALPPAEEEAKPAPRRTRTRRTSS